MNHLSKILLGIIAAFVIPTCSSVCICERTSKAHSPRELSLQDSNVNISLKHILSKEIKFSPNFKINFYQKRGNLYACLLTTDGRMIFANLRDSSDVRSAEIPFGFDKSNNILLSYFEQDTIHLVESRSRVYHKLLLTPDYTLKQISRVELDKIFPGDWVIDVQPTSMLVVNTGVLYVPYNIWGAFNYIDSAAYLKFELNERSYSKTVSWPDCYRNCRVYSENVTVAFKGNESYFLFSSISQLNRYDSTGHLTPVYLPTNYIFEPFDERQEQNLAYARNYELLKETNLFIIPMAGGYAVFRRMARSQITDPVKSEILFFSDENIYLGSKTIPFSPTWANSQGKRILVLNDSVTKMSFYEPK